MIIEKIFKNKMNKNIAVKAGIAKGSSLDSDPQGVRP